MSDNEFSTLLGFESGLKREVCLQIRHTTAAQCKMDRDLVTPDEDTELLSNRTSAGWDNVMILADLEQTFGVSLEGVCLPNFTMERFFFFFKRDKPANFGEWVKQAVEILVPVIAEQIENRQTGKKAKSE